MSEPIKVGDLVMLVRGMPCCGARGNKDGETFIVERIEHNEGYCAAGCGKYVNLSNAFGRKHKYGYTLSRLLRIDPPAISSTTDQPEELTA